MRRGSKSKRTPSGVLGGLQVVCLSLGVFAAQVWLAPAAASSFRLAKETALVVLFGAAGVVWLWERTRRDGLLFAGSPLLGALSLYPVILAASALWAWNPWASLLAAGRSAVWVLGVFALSRLADKDLMKVAGWAIAGGGVSALTALIQAAGGSPIQVENVIGRGQVIGLAGNPNDIAMVCLVSAPLLLLWRTGRAGTLVRVLMLGVFVGAIVVSQSRAGLIGLALEVVAVLVVLAQRRVPRRVLLAVSVGMAAILLAGLWVALPRFELALSERSTVGLLGASQRGAGWSAAVSMIESRPLVGVGGDNYSCRFAPARLRWLVERGETRSKEELQGHFATAHSEPLQVAAELGGLGVLWMVGLLLAFAHSRCWRQPPVGIAVAGLIPLMLLHYPFHLAVVLAPSAIYVALGVKRRDQHDDRSGRRLRLPGWVALVAIAVVLVVVWLQVESLRLNAWQRKTGASLENLARMTRSGSISKTERDAVLVGIQRDAIEQIKKVTAERPYLWRDVGRCRLVAGDPHGAEVAFKKSLAQCPTVEAYFGMGLAMVNQGRPDGGLPWLLDACRVNPRLGSLIPDQDLRTTVMGMLGIDDNTGFGNHRGSGSRGAGTP